MQIAIVGSAALLSAAILGAAAFGRFEIATQMGSSMIYRVDRLTGQIESCESVVLDGYAKASALPTRGRPKWCGG